MVSKAVPTVRHCCDVHNIVRSRSRSDQNAGFAFTLWWSGRAGRMALFRVFVSCHHDCFNHVAAFPITNFQFATIHTLPFCVRNSPDILSKLLHLRNMLRTYGMPMHTSYLYRHNFLAEIFATPSRPPRALGLPCFLR